MSITIAIASPAIAITAANISQPCGLGITRWVSTHGAAATCTTVPIWKVDRYCARRSGRASS
jgi:hypothetical protein